MPEYPVRWTTPTDLVGGAINSDNISAGARKILIPAYPEGNTNPVIGGNAARRDRRCCMMVYLTWVYQDIGTVPQDGLPVSLYFLYSLDGSTFEDGSASIEPKNAPIYTACSGSVAYASGDIGQRIFVKDVVLYPFPFKVLVQNGTDQALNSISVWIYSFTETQIQP